MRYFLTECISILRSVRLNDVLGNPEVCLLASLMFSLMHRVTDKVLRGTIRNSAIREDRRTRIGPFVAAHGETGESALTSLQLRTFCTSASSTKDARRMLKRKMASSNNLISLLKVCKGSGPLGRNPE